VRSDFESRLASRSAEAGLELPPLLLEKLAVYYELLQRWNRKINLTSLSNPDEAIDRLLLEPVAAAASLRGAARLIDLGSGGGSPAIPLALALSAPLLVMVESRSRKAAFLREAVRELALTAVVENARIEEVARRPEYRRAMTIVSIRAVRIEVEVLAAAAAFLEPGGVVALFESAAAEATALLPELLLSSTKPLMGRSRLTLLRRA
jgi:16S rRNA (guanine527-N7)-methyltransferase